MIRETTFFIISKILSFTIKGRISLVSGGDIVWWNKRCVLDVRAT